jgi:hypothetical protein
MAMLRKNLPLRTSVLSLAAVATAWPALAHTPYLLPNTFDAERTRVTIQGALTEDDYFNPDIALNVPAITETLPSGQTAELKPNIKLSDLTVFEAPLDQDGTYRFTTGQFAGRKSTYAHVGDKWLMIRQPRPGGGRPGGEGAPRPAGEGPPKPPGGDGDGPPGIAEADVPAGAETRVSEQVQVVETYVSKGAPTQGPLKTTGQGFELKPITHPNAVFVDQGFAFELIVDGKPVANQAISVYRSGNIYDDKRIAVTLKTDVAGKGKISFTQPGVYLLTTSYPASRPAPGEAPPAHSYTYSLTFEVTR